MRDLRNKRALITGGARGIGLALAARLAAEAVEVLLVDVDPEALSEAAVSISRTGARVSSYVADVSDPQAVSKLRTAIHDQAGRVDILVNNAGIVRGGAFLDVSLDEHLRTYEVNTLAPVVVTHAFLPDLIEGQEGHLVNISSASGFIGLPYGSTYASSKWSVTGFSESLRLELGVLGHRHVGVTTVCPSYASTGLFEGARPPRATRLVAPEKLARLTVQAIRRNRPFVLTPWLVKLTPPLKGVLPTRMFDSVAGLLGATHGMEDWQGRG
jgi:short-subunit dehydrogenase